MRPIHSATAAVDWLDNAPAWLTNDGAGVSGGSGGAIKSTATAAINLIMGRR